MNQIIAAQAESLPGLIQRAAQALANATSAAEVLDARQLADLRYDDAKRIARMAKAEAAHDEVIAAAHRAQGDALEIKAQASRRYFEETQAAIQRGEIPGRGGNRGNQHIGGKVEDVHFANPARHKEINREGSAIDRAERSDPGIVRRVINDSLHRCEEPSKSALRQAVAHVVQHGYRQPTAPPASRRNPLHEPNADFDRTARVAGLCVSLVEKTEGLTLTDILSGCTTAGMRARTLSDLRGCCDRLCSLLEAHDATEA